MSPNPDPASLPARSSSICRNSCIAHNVESPDLGAYEAAINELVCQNCKSSPTAGDYCADGQIRSCPLSRYSGDVVDVLEKAEQAWRRGK
ncbi:MAG: hypothetical protein HND57_14625 [Planctomycetes bacterium]|nr:hypothetical protein [Planctomycetota bacterium]